MLAEVKVPELSEGATQGVLVNWHKSEGDFVSVGESLFDIETNKVVIEVPSVVSGRIVKILQSAGDDVTVGQIAAHIDTAAAGAYGKEEQGDAAAVRNSTAAAERPTMRGTEKAEPFAMPAAKKLLDESGLSNTEVSGTGRGGRITKTDVAKVVNTSGLLKRFDVVVIGAGPGGYVAAIRAAQLGFSVACVEKATYDDPKGEVRLGGTCLNVGCIPSKALLQSSQIFDEANHGFSAHGISASNVKMDVQGMMKRKESIVVQLTQGVRGLFKKNKITLLEGHGKFVGRAGDFWRIDVNGDVIEARNVIVATGSRPRQLPGVEVDNITVCDNAGALSLTGVPQKLGVIGAGVIGLELGSVWKRLGAEVTVLEAGPTFLPAADEAISKEVWKVIAKQGLNIHLGIEIKSISKSSAGISITYLSSGEERTLVCDKLIVSVGRIPNTDSLGADIVGLKIDSQGRIEVDEKCRTNLETVWAVGDVVKGPMLAHKGMEEGVMVAELIAGQSGHINLDAIPWVIYTHPEIAWVGKTEQQLKAAGIEYRVGQIPFAANGRALSQGDSFGFVKIVADAKTDRVLGMHIFGNNASELISEGVTAIEFGATSEDVARICHAHPTLSEAVHEAALSVDKRALHF
jgi:dihydrolipoamide dehydrogenase